MVKSSCVFLQILAVSLVITIILVKMTESGPIIPASQHQKSSPHSSGGGGSGSISSPSSESPSSQDDDNSSSIGRIERSTNLSHITGTARKIRMYIRNRYLQILPDGSVNGTTDEASDYTILQRSSVSLGQVKIQGVATCMFLCMDSCGLLFSSKDFSDECVFNEMTEQHHYNTYSSAKNSNEKKMLYISLSKKGVPRKVQIKTGTPLGRFSSYTKVLPQPVEPQRVEQLTNKVLSLYPTKQHHQLRHHQLCPPANNNNSGKSITESQKCKKRKRRKKRRKCQEETSFDYDSEECYNNNFSKSEEINNNNKKNNVKKFENKDMEEHQSKKKCEEQDGGEEKCQQKKLNNINRKRKSRNESSESKKKFLKNSKKSSINEKKSSTIPTINEDSDESADEIMTTVFPEDGADDEFLDND